MRTKEGNGPKADFEQLLEDLKVVVQDGEQLLKTGVSTVRERAVTSAKATGRIVHEHPYHTVAVVFGLGIVFGLLAFGMMTRQPEEYDGEDM
jgi:ElaB/YqjD/DUF883 family membrane-anchored ribosome-binding protein